MKKTARIVAGLLILGAQFCHAGDEEQRVFVGEIGDSQCAMNIHSLTRSHKEMLKSKAMGGDAAACASYCTKYLGGNFVLVVKNEVYHLDDQNHARLFAGRRVQITGSLDSKNNTVHVFQIEPK